MLLQKKRAIITGGSMGLGLVIAKAFVAQGASVVICARDSVALKNAQEELRAIPVKNRQTICAHVCDISDENQVDQLFAQALEAMGGLDILVNNAGVYGPKGSVEELDRSEWRRAIETNLFGTLYTCQKAIAIFKQQEKGKIINMSGGGATAPLPYISAYSASKAAVVRLTETISEEVKQFRIDINAVAPGALHTRLMEEVLEAGPEKVGASFYQATIRQQESGGTSLDKGAQLCVFLASSQSDGITGKLISAVWDSWTEFNDHRNDIESTDIYTLRRIVPKDRGMDWETL
jgi:NAD(P)-dependent dehydrogenase (short-subunit alcohol dehydrogenase family)